MSNTEIFIPSDSTPVPVVETIVKNIETYNDNVKHYFETQVGSSILNLPEEEKVRCFQMFTDYADILNKILIPGVDIFEHILGIRFAAANENPHEGIDFNYDCPIIREYDEWKASQK